MKKISTILDAHMPFLFEQNSEPHMLCAKNSGLFKLRELNLVRWKTSLVTDIQNPKLIPKFVPFSQPSDVECSPIYLRGLVQEIVTRDTVVFPINESGRIILPVWGSLPYGWKTKGFETWGVFDINDTVIGWEENNKLTKIRVCGQEKFTLYRVVPINDRPVCTLFTVLTSKNVPRTFVLNRASMTLQELKVEGNSVYKSSIFKQYCAFAVKRPDSLTRDVHIYDGYELVAAPDVRIELV